MASLPHPVPGLVVGYSYLWEAEFRNGREEGRKDRPCAIILATRMEEGDLVVTVAPITHAEPGRPGDALEVPPDIKRRLGLDEQRSWLVCAEVNRFVWPGPDLRPVSRRRPGEFAYGVLPPSFLRQVYDRLRVLRIERRTRVVFRSP